MVKEVFVKRRNGMINLLKLRNLRQGPDQPVQQYVSSLKQIARTCKFTMVCSADGCDRQNDYSEEMVLDQLTMGLNDDKIQRRVLGCKEENFNLDFVEKLVINEECTEPKEWLAIGNTYTQRYNKITEHVKQVKRRIDDSLLYS